MADHPTGVSHHIAEGGPKFISTDGPKFIVTARRGYTLHNSVPIGPGKVFWTKVSYSVDPQARQLTIDEVWGPDVEAMEAGGWREISSCANGYVGRRISVPMFEAPQPDWPCKPQTWAAVEASERYTPPTRPARPSGGGGQGGAGGFSFPRPSIVNPCMYTNGRVVPNCHR